MDDTRFFPSPDAGASPLASAGQRKGAEFSRAHGMPDAPDGPDAWPDGSAPPEAGTLAELENMLQDIRQELPHPLPPQAEPDTLAELTSVLEDIRQELPSAKSPPASAPVSPPPEAPQDDGFHQDMSSTLLELTSILTELTGKNPVRVSDPAKPAAPASLNPPVQPSPLPPDNPSTGLPPRASSRKARPTDESTAFPADTAEPEVPPARPWGNNHPRPPRHGLITPAFTGRNPLGDEHLLLPPDLLDFLPEPDTPDTTPEWDVPPVPVAMDLPPEISWDSLWEDEPARNATPALPDDVPLRSFIPPEDLPHTEDRETDLPADMPPLRAMPDFPATGQPDPDAGSRPAETAAAATAPHTPAKASALSSPAPSADAAASVTAPAAAPPSFTAAMAARAAAARERTERREARERARKERRQRQADTAAKAAPQPPAPPVAKQSAKPSAKQPEEQAALGTLSELRKLLSAIAVPPSGSADGKGGSGKPGVQPPVSPWRQPARGPLPPPRCSRSSADVPEKHLPETPEANAGPLPVRDVWRAPRPSAAPARPSGQTASEVVPNPADAALLPPPADLDDVQPAPAPFLDLTGIAQAMNLEFHAARHPDPASDISPILLPVPDAGDTMEPLPATPDDDAPAIPLDALSAPAVETAPGSSPDDTKDAPKTTPMTATEFALLPPDSAEAASPSAAMQEMPPATPEAKSVNAASPPSPATGRELPPGWLNRLGQRLRRAFRHSSSVDGPKTNRPPLRARTDDLTVTAPTATAPPPVGPAPGGLMQRLREMEAEHRERLRVLSERPRGPVYPSAEARSHLLRYSLAADEPSPARRRRLTDDDFPGVPGDGPIHVLRDKPTALERFFRTLRARMRNESFRQGVRTAAFYTAVLAALGGALYASSHPDQVDRAVQFLLRLIP